MFNKKKSRMSDAAAKEWTDIKDKSEIETLQDPLTMALESPMPVDKADSNDDSALYLSAIEKVKCKDAKLIAEGSKTMAELAESRGDAIAQNELGYMYQYGIGVEESPELALKWYNRAADQGLQQAMYNVALCYANGVGLFPDLDEAFSRFRVVADQHMIVEAELQLGYAYEHGLGVERDSSAATQHFKAGAARTNPVCMGYLGLQYLKGHGVERDSGDAYRWLERAAEKGVVLAECYLATLLAEPSSGNIKQNLPLSMKMLISSARKGFLPAFSFIAARYVKGLGVPVDLKKALHYYTMGAELGDPDSCVELGHFYKNGTGVARDYSTALSWYRKAMDDGSPKGEYALALMYRDGLGVDADLQKMKRYLTNAAEEDLPEALVELGNMHLDGNNVERDANEAMRLFRRAADLGYPDAQYKVGQCFASGIGVSSANALEAFNWYRRAASNNHPEAVCQLGYCYQKGIGVTVDVDESIKWYEKSAELGYPLAQFNLGVCYRDGRGVRANNFKALRWFTYAAMSGNADAMCQLGYFYHYGKGLCVNNAESVKWYIQAAEKGSALAQYNLAVCYRDGIGVAQSIPRARYWLDIAANNGVEAASRALKDLN